MKKNKIKYHMLLEYHSFLDNLANYENEFKKHKEFSEPDDFVRDFIESTYNDLSPIMKSDLKLLFKDSVLVSHTIISPQIVANIKNYKEFSRKLSEMNADDYIKLFILSSSEEETFGKTEEESINHIEEQFQKMDMGDTIIESYKELKKYPQQTMDRIRNFLDRFYYEYFEAVEGKIETFLKERIAKHQEIFDKDREKFVKEIVKVSFDGQEMDDLDFDYFLGYFNPGKLSYHKDGNKLFCYYSYKYEQLFDPAFFEKQLTEFFKTLADETRLNMVRKLTEKSYYSSELADELGINKATVSYHMKMFSRFNIIDISLGKNKRIYYRVNKKNLEDFFARFMNTLR